jgi:16S rRNA (cytidine1402-2'-O)-methyltransferase
MNTEYGKLYLVATPIGNLGDITLRALETLREADLIAAEDTRQTGKLLSHFQIKKPMLSYFEHNKAQRGPRIIEKLKAGQNVALVSDAGTPGISDPGADIVKEALAEGISVTMTPGPAAGIMALVLSGLDTRRFVFEGFLPEEKKSRNAILEQLVTEQRTTVLYESPHRILSTLKEMCAVFGGSRRVALCRELTKMYEEILLKSIDGHLADFAEKAPRGEYVMVLEGADPGVLDEQNRAAWADLSVKDHVDGLIAQGLDRKAAIKKAALERGSTRNEIYSAYESEKTDS